MRRPTGVGVSDRVINSDVGRIIGHKDYFSTGQQNPADKGIRPPPMRRPTGVRVSDGVVNSDVGRIHGHKNHFSTGQKNTTGKSICPHPMNRSVSISRGGEGSRNRRQIEGLSGATCCTKASRDGSGGTSDLEDITRVIGEPCDSCVSSS